MKKEIEDWSSSRNERSPSTNSVEDWFYMMLESECLEDLLERFNVDAIDAFLLLIKEGYIDEELLNDMMRVNEVYEMRTGKIEEE